MIDLNFENKWFPIREAKNNWLPSKRRWYSFDLFNHSFSIMTYNQKVKFIQNTKHYLIINTTVTLFWPKFQCWVWVYKTNPINSAPNFEGGTDWWGIRGALDSICDNNGMILVVILKIVEHIFSIIPRKISRGSALPTSFQSMLALRSIMNTEKALWYWCRKGILLPSPWV